MDCQPGDAQQVGGIKINPSPAQQHHRNRREPRADRYEHEDKQIFFQGDKVYFISSSDVIDKTQIGTIINKNQNGSLFGDPRYEVNFKNVSDGTERINPNCSQSDIVLVLTEDLMQGGGKHRKISKKNRKSKHRKSKHRKSKHRKSKHRKTN